MGREELVERVAYCMFEADSEGAFTWESMKDGFIEVASEIVDMVYHEAYSDGYNAGLDDERV